MSKRPVRHYLYADEIGRPMLRKVRYEPKAFRIESLALTQDGIPVWVPGIRDGRLRFAERALYHLPEVLWAFRDGRPVWWCEGEKDADALRGIGVVATSHYQGACNATYQQAQVFERESESQIYLVADNDIAGAACVLHRQHLLLEVGVNQDRIALLAPPPKHRDVFDMVAAGLGIDDLRKPDIKRVMRAAKKYLKLRRAGKRPGDYWSPSS